MNKSLQFAKNLGLSSLTYAAAGGLGSKIYGLISGNEWLISAATTVTEFASGYYVLLRFHRKDNIDVFKNDAKEYQRNTRRLLFILGVLEPLYFAGRTVLHTYFQNKGYSPLEADLMADGICIPGYNLAAFILAKYCGVIKEN